MHNLLERLAKMTNPDAWNHPCTCVNCEITKARLQVMERGNIRKLLAEGTRDEWDAMLDEARGEGEGR